MSASSVTIVVQFGFAMIPLRMPRTVSGLISGTLDRRRRAVVFAMLAIAGGLFIAAAVYLLRVIDDYPAIETVGRGLALLTAGGGIAVLAGVLVYRRWPIAGAAAFAATVVSIYLVAAAWGLPAANAYKSARPFCSKLQSLVSTDDPLRSYRFWNWRPADQRGIEFQCGWLWVSMKPG